MKKNANLGAQLAKSLTFEVEATPYNNVLEIKNAENMTPLNVKVRVRKKIDGTSSVKKGIIAVPRMDLPDTPVERLRLASSDQTIMSFNMLMEADFEKKEVKKAKRGFFGICLGLQGEDYNNEDQYLPTASSLEKDCRSDSRIGRFRHTKPIDENSFAETTSSKSRKKDKFFGKCKPGGCLDPPFGEDKYAYQPQPTQHKNDKNSIDDTTEVDLKRKSEKIFLKQKAIEVVDATDKEESSQKVDKSILSLYQGKANTADEESFPEDIITYPPELYYSGLLKTDEKNKKSEVKRSSGARHSRNSFNEFSAEYFSLPRTPRDSIDSQKSQVKQIQTKEIFTSSQAMPKPMSPAKYIRTIGKKGSKDNSPTKTSDWDSTTSYGLAGLGAANTGQFGLGTPLGTRNETDKYTDLGIVSSQGIPLDGKDNAKIIPDGTVPKTTVPMTTPQAVTSDLATAAGLAGVGIATTGLVGLGIALGTKNNKLTDHKEKPLQTSKELSSRDPKQQHDFGAPPEEFQYKYSETDTQDMHSDLTPERRLKITEQDETEGTKTNVPPGENASLDIRSSPITHMIKGNNERDLVFHGVDLIDGSEKRISQVGNTILNRPIHDDTYKDLVPTGIPTNGPSERTFLRSGISNEREGVPENFPPIEIDVTGNSDHQEIRPINGLTNDYTDKRNLPQNRSRGSEGTLFRAGRATNETNDQHLRSKEETMIERSNKKPQLKEKIMYDDSIAKISRGSEPGDPPIGSATDLSTKDQSAKRITSSQKPSLPMQRGSGTEEDLMSRVENVLQSSERGLLLSPLKTAENRTTLKQRTISNESEIMYSASDRQIDSDHILGKSFVPSGLNPTERDRNTFTNYDVEKSQLTQQGSENIASWANTPSRSNMDDFKRDSNASYPNDTRFDKASAKIKTFNDKRDSSPTSKSESGYQRSISFNVDDFSTGRSVKHDASVSSDVNILQYREIESHVSRGSSQKVYWENKNERTATPIKTESHDSRGSSQRNYWENNDERTATPIGNELHDSRGSLKRDHWENKDERTATPIKIESHNYIDSSPKEYQENKDGRAATPIGIESYNSRGSSQKEYQENKDRRAATPPGIKSHDSKGSSQKGYWQDKDGQTTTPIGIESHDSRGSSEKQFWENKDARIAAPIRIASFASKDSSQKVGPKISRESIFLNLAFQTYQDDDQIAIKTLDSAKNYGQSNTVLVKSLVRSHDKTGVTVPIDPKHVMNITITSTPVQERKSRIPKPISKLDSGRSDYSDSTVSIKDIGNDPHAVLSLIFHQELVPLESIIRSLKEDIDSLAAQQMMLTDRLSDTLESQRIRPQYTRKCGCIKQLRTLSLEEK